jgi:RNA polymerase sigma-32 factor
MIGQADKLTPRERRVLEARLLADDPMTLEELAEEFGVCRARVKQLEARVIEKCGDSLRGKKVANR